MDASGEWMSPVDRAAREKNLAKLDGDKVGKAVAWIEAVTGTALVGTFDVALRDGQVLCSIINVVKPGTITVSDSNKAFHQLENITLFLRAAAALGLPNNLSFDTLDLHEAKDLNAVIITIYALAGVLKAKGYEVPELLSDEASAAKGKSVMVGANATQQEGASYHSQLPTAFRKSVNVSPPDKTVFKSAADTVAASQGVEQSGEDWVSPVDRAAREKIVEKLGGDKVSRATAWIEAVTGETLVGTFEEALKDGQVLCRLLNHVKAGTVAKPSASKMGFHQLNNITLFLRAAQGLGMPSTYAFDTLDLYEAKDLNAVINCIYGLAASLRQNGFNVPELLSAEAEAAKGKSVNVGGPDTQGKGPTMFSRR